MLIRCWVSSTIMTPRTRKEKFLYRGSIEDCADLLLGIKCDNDSYVVEARWCCLWERWCMTLGQVPLRGLMYDSGNYLWEGCYMTLGRVPLKGLMYDFRKSAFERAADICEKKFLWLGLACIVLENRFWDGCWCIWKTMPLVRTYMYDSINFLSKGCCCMCETMPLSRLLMCVQNNASR